MATKKRTSRDIAKKFFQRKDHRKVIIAGDGAVFEWKHRDDQDRARAYARKHGLSLDFIHRDTFKKEEQAKFHAIEKKPYPVNKGKGKSNPKKS